MINLAKTVVGRLYDPTITKRQSHSPEAAVTRLTRRLGDVLRANAELTFLVCVFAASLVLAVLTRGYAWV